MREVSSYCVAVVGSRTFTDRALLYQVLDELLAEIGRFILITGAACGADKLAEEWAIERQLSTSIHLPNWKDFGKAAGPIRNRKMIDAADWVVAFWDGYSPGTKDSIVEADRQNKLRKVYEFSIEPERPSPERIQVIRELMLQASKQMNVERIQEAIDMLLEGSKDR